MSDDFDPDTGEVKSTALAPLQGGSSLVMTTRAEIDSQIATARAYPRDLGRAVRNITQLATLDEDTAEECLYALTRGQKKNNRTSGAQDSENKPIEGPSIRLAEIAAQCYGNCRIEARVVEVNRAEKYVEAEGVFLDLETNMASKTTTRRRISTRNGGIFSDDMILVTGNAACAIAKRNAILSGIPRGVYRPAYAAARKLIAGDASTLGESRDKAIKAFARFGITPDQVLVALNVESEIDITTEHIVTLRGMFGTLVRKEATPEEMFSRGESDHKKIANPLSDEEPATEEAAAGEAKRDPAAEGVAEEVERENTKTDKAGVRAPKLTPVEVARGRGKQAKADGLLRKAMPPEYREESRADEADAWRAGYDAEPEGGGEYQPGQEG